MSKKSTGRELEGSRSENMALRMISEHAAYVFRECPVGPRKILYSMVDILNRSLLQYGEVVAPCRQVCN
jgi:hypothetical protein